MSLNGFDYLHATADSAKPHVPVAVAGAADPTVLIALSQARARGWVQPILAGPADEIVKVAAVAGVDTSPFQIIDAADSAVAAVEEIHSGRARMLMKGQVDTPTLMRAVLDDCRGLRTGRTVCQVVLMEIVDQNRRFLLADTGITIQPALAQKVEILESLIAAARALGATRPRVALVAATEKSTPAMPDTLESAELARRNAAGQFAGAIVEGPMSFDLAYSIDAGEKKRIEGEVVGAADALMFPNLVAANLTVKAMMYAARSRFGGILCGLATPVVFMSRGDTVATRLNSLALALQLGPIIRPAAGATAITGIDRVASSGNSRDSPQRS
jgi:phosphate butyryltransferase